MSLARTPYPDDLRPGDPLAVIKWTRDGPYLATLRAAVSCGDGDILAYTLDHESRASYTLHHPRAAMSVLWVRRDCSLAAQGILAGRRLGETAWWYGDCS